MSQKKTATITLKILSATVKKKLFAQALEICALLKVKTVNEKLNKF
jgi:hypothetical protein